MKKISFDFDNTIVMSYMTYDGETPIPVFQSYNSKIINKIKDHIEAGDDVHIVTARTRSLEKHFPEQTVEFHLEKLGLKDYFWPDRVIYTNTGAKKDILTNLGVSKHYDDSIEEHSDGLEASYEVIQPLDDLKDSDHVGKVVIYDKSGRVLVLQRSDEGHLWDLPGGHIKHVEVERGEEGLEDGTDREVFEETGLLLPFLKHFMTYDFTHRGIVHKIHIYLSSIDEVTPDVRLDLQDFVENIDFRWVPLETLEQYMGRTTTNLRKAYDHLSIQDEIFEQNEPFQLKMKRNHRNKKRKLLGLGKNKHFGGGKGHSRPSMSRSKSAPPGFGAIGEEKEHTLDENKKKIKIKINFEQELDEKRKKRRKKRKKRKRNYGVGSYYPFYDLYDSGNSGDSGGDGGE